MSSNSSRRNFIRKTAALTGGAFAAAGAARAAPLPVPQANQEPGRIIEETAYGMPSKFEAHVKRRRTDVFKNRQNLSDWSMTPLQHQPGIITPNGLIFERHHAGTPDIDPEDAPARDPRHGEAAAGIRDGRSHALSRRCRASISTSARATASPTGSSPPRPPCSRRTACSPACCGPACRPRR